MIGGFALDYFLFVFIAALGVLQVVAAHNSLKGLLIVRLRPVAYTGGLAITVAACLWFFLSEPRNIPDVDGGLAGNQSAGLFTLGAVLALAVTLLTSSFSNRSWGNGASGCGPGIEAMRDTTYVKAVLGTLKGLWKRS